MAAKKAASKKKAPKAKKKGKKKAQAAPAAAATTPKKKKAKKKAAAKKPAKKKKKARGSAPKKKAKKAKKAKAKKARASAPKKKAAKRPKSRPAAAAAPAKPKKKRAKKKAKASAPAKPKKKRAKKKKASTTVTASSKTTPSGAKKRTKGKKKISQTTKYKSKKTGEVWTVKRRFQANPIDGAMNFVVLAGGGLLGFEAADMLDRFIATRTPSGAKFPWYGTDAAHRQMARPDGMRILGMGVLGAAFFAGAVFTRKRFVKTSYFLGGVAMGAFLKLGHSLLVGYVWPKLWSVEKGTERSWGNRMYPLEQDKLQAIADKKIQTDNKNAGDAVTKKDDSLTPNGQKDADGKGMLPQSYAYPTDKDAAAAKDFTYGVGKPPAARAGRIERTERSLPSPESRVTPDLRRQVSGYEDEPVARPAPKSDLGRSGGVSERHGGGRGNVACGDGECGRPGCPACGDDPNPNVQMPDGAFPPGGGTNLANHPCIDSTGAQGMTDDAGVCQSTDTMTPPSGQNPPADRGPSYQRPNIQISGRRGNVSPSTTAGMPSLDQILRGNFN